MQVFFNKNFHLFVFALFVFIFSGEAFCSTPRLLITLGHRCEFTAKKLQNEVEGVLISGTKKQMMTQIIKQDVPHSNHLMIIKDKFEGLSSFASQMGYVHLHLNENFKKSLKLLKETISTTPKSEKDLPKNDPLTVGLFYDLLMKIDRFLKKHKLPYWATCGTLLGVVRHHGMIPWDDDIDLAMFEEDVSRLLQLEETLVEINLGLAFHPKYEFYKIFPLDGELILRDNGEPYPWRFPFVDIFAMRDIQEKYTYTGQIWQEE